MATTVSSNGTANGHTNGASTNGNKIASNGTSSLQPPVEVAVSPTDAPSVTPTIEKINSLGGKFSASDNASRLALLTEARRLVRALEMPRETMIKHNWAQVSSPLRRNWAWVRLC